MCHPDRAIPITVTTSNQLAKESAQRTRGRVMSPLQSQEGLAFGAKASVRALRLCVWESDEHWFHPDSSCCSLGPLSFSQPEGLALSNPFSTPLRASPP